MTPCPHPRRKPWARYVWTGAWSRDVTVCHECSAAERELPEGWQYRWDGWEGSTFVYRLHVTDAMAAEAEA